MGTRLGPWPQEPQVTDEEFANNTEDWLMELQGRDATLGTTSQNTQTGTSYTLVLSDAGKVVEMNNASANTLTVPPKAVFK